MIGDDQIAPEDALTKARSQRLSAGFLGSEPQGVGRRRVRSFIGFYFFAVGIYALCETLAEAFQGSFHSTDIAEVGADTQDHAERSPLASARALSTNARMRLMELSKPPKIASPIRK